MLLPPLHSSPWCPCPALLEIMLNPHPVHLCQLWVCFQSSWDVQPRPMSCTSIWQVHSNTFVIHDGAAGEETAYPEVL